MFNHYSALLKEFDKKSVSEVQLREINQNSHFWTNKFPSPSVYSALKYCFPRGIYPNH